ncbi:MAG: hypothetical protein IJY04_00720 [Clostridia bacterium]|nr:hypothetical protein [Clostridia bacterium]
MKKKFKIILAAIIVIAAATCLCACSQWNTPYDTLDGEGYKVSVRFDVNGGMFAGTNDVYIVDVFNVANAKVNTEGKVELPLLSPEDQRRGMNAFTASKNGCFLAGWYTERTPRVNEKGEPLDEYGQLVSESGREQGYEYSGKWDFSTDKLELDPNGKYTSEET